MEKEFLTNDHVLQLACDLLNRLERTKRVKTLRQGGAIPSIYPIPRGGVPVAYMLPVVSSEDIDDDNMLTSYTVTDDIKMADIVIDDIICTGNTIKRVLQSFSSQRQEYLIIDALIPKPKDGIWYVFPWEKSLVESEESATDIVTRFFQVIGEDPEREGLKETPQRVIRSWEELYKGYTEEPKDILSKCFDKEDYDQMIVLNGHTFYSMCEHHILPFIGKAHIAYVPSLHGKVVGISKLARLVDCFSRRLQIQERMTNQIEQAISKYLNPMGVAVFIEAHHLCMEMRGVKSTTSKMRTSCLTGIFRQAEVRSEFFNLIK